MNSLNDVWDKVLEKLGADITPTAVSTWFSDCTPLLIDNFKLVIHTPSEFKRDLIAGRFEHLIQAALTDIFSSPYSVQIIWGEQENAGTDSDLPNLHSYTFRDFIVGSSNRFAHAAALSVATHPGKAFNPLFIYGNSGLGKTHLLLAIGQMIKSQNANTKIAYVKGDSFTNDMVSSIKDNTQEEFRNRYRYANLFLVDDIQFIAGKMGVQEEFFHTFNALYEAGSQIVITSDRPPMEISKLEDRLRSRFEGGLLADVQPPDLETRIAIVRNKSAQLGIPIDEPDAEFLAETVTSNIRQIEGVINRTLAFRDIMGLIVNRETIKRAIKDVIRSGEYVPTPEIIIQETAQYYSLTEEDLRGQRRSKNMAMARQVAMYLIRSMINLPLADIGSEFENRNHTTVLSSIRKIEDMVKSDPETAGAVKDIMSNINTRSNA